MYVAPFLSKYHLPANPTTAFLTPALRNRNITLTPDINLVGRPPKLYQTVLQLFTDVYSKKVTAEDLLAETIRCLVILRDEKQKWMNTVIEGLRTPEETFPLSAEAIVTLIEQHLKSKGASRLPVLLVAAAYTVSTMYLGEQVLPLKAHNAADEQTGAVGDVEITLIDDTNIVTCYEMKMRRVSKEDIDRAMQKINNYPGKRIDHYIFITTEVIEDAVKDYAGRIYEQSGGIEVVILDCIAFLRHFLHLFYRLRMRFLDVYQALVLAEPESAIRQPLKEVFLALRQAAESAE